MPANKTKSNYHHGELEKSLIEAALQMLRDGGIESLSLRKLAERVGVSRTAPYHHFKDKNDLLCAVAAYGFKQKHQTIAHILNDNSLTNEAGFKQFVYSYVQNATENPELYDLMFGRPIWKSGSSNEALQSIAYPVFQQQLDLIKHWQDAGVLDASADTLRLSQVIWSTLHGITRLIIDGIYSNSTNGTEQLKEICDCAIAQFIQ